MQKGGESLLFVAAHTHLAAKCPSEPPEGKTMIKKLFSDDNVRNSGIKIVGAYVSCPKDKSTEHKGFFIIDADSAPAVTKFFGPMTVGVRPVVPFSEVAKPCSAVQRSLLTIPFYQEKVSILE
jgi:hypothetical protein